MHDYHDYCFYAGFAKTDYKHVKLFSNVCKNGKLIIISDDYHDSEQLRLLPAVKNCTISIIFKGNMTFNRQNWLIAHP